MSKNIFFWGGKFKAGIILSLIEKNKILTNTSSYTLKYIFDPNLSKAQFSSNAAFSNKKSDLKKLCDYQKKVSDMTINHGLDLQKSEIDAYKNYRGRWKC